MLAFVREHGSAREGDRIMGRALEFLFDEAKLADAFEDFPLIGKNQIEEARNIALFLRDLIDEESIAGNGRIEHECMLDIDGTSIDLWLSAGIETQVTICIGNRDDPDFDPDEDDFIMLINTNHGIAENIFQLPIDKNSLRLTVIFAMNSKDWFD